MSYKCQLPNWNIHNARIIVRADLNVPLGKQGILSDLKLHAIRPTLDYLIAQKSIVILITHLGNPQTYDSTLSTRILLPWIRQFYTVTFAETIADISLLTQNNAQGTIILCENIRFFKEEIEENMAFAQQLKECADFYVNDGFACMHRKETTITLLPQLFSHEKKTIGFYTQKELSNLDTIIHHAKKPMIALIGGKKLKSKMPYIYELFKIVDTIVICPALMFTFLKAQGISVGESLVDTSMIPVCQELLTWAQENNLKIILPIDVIISLNGITGPYTTVPSKHIPDNAMGISIGEKTIALLEQTIQRAQTIIYNGAMGFIEAPPTLNGMHLLLQIIAQSKAVSLIAGGDSVAAVYYLEMQKCFTHLSLGGGATLFYITHKTLPGLQVFNK